jgi:hypothetical protein
VLTDAIQAKSPITRAQLVPKTTEARTEARLEGVRLIIKSKKNQSASCNSAISFRAETQIAQFIGGIG